MEITGKKWVKGQWVDTTERVKKGRERIKGIYAIELEALKLVYVGQSVNIKSRWYQHKHVLNRNQSENKELQEYWNKYPDKFVFKVIELTDNLTVREKEIANDYLNKGYKLLNSYFIATKGENTSIMIRDEHKGTVVKLLRLIDKGRIDLEQFNNYLDTL